jgi:hypothetical protein
MGHGSCSVCGKTFGSENSKAKWYHCPGRSCSYDLCETCAKKIYLKEEGEKEEEKVEEKKESEPEPEVIPLTDEEKTYVSDEAFNRLEKELESIFKKI